MSAADWLRAVMAPERTLADVLAYADLDPAEQAEVGRRIKAGLRHPNAKVRALAWRTAEDVAVSEMGAGEPPLPRHVALEVEAALARGRPLQPGEPVPRCGCFQCTGIPGKADSGTIDCPDCGGLRDFARDETAAFLICMSCGTYSLRRWPLDELGELADELPFIAVPEQDRAAPRHVLKDRGVSDEQRLRAREVPVTEVARLLGLTFDPRRLRYAHCPFHHDAHASLHLNDSKQRAFCNPCGKSWDAIGLVMAVYGLAWPAAVRFLSGTA